MQLYQWAERRVFYCTPQTLDNDLKKGSVDPRDIVLAVFGTSQAPFRITTPR
jgi:ATP-dependent DNA helicase MPH1